MQTALADQFASLWESTNSPPDVLGFLDEHAAHSLRDKLAVLLIDQSRRWQTDEPISVEEYLEKLHEMASDKQAVLDLVVGEYQAREASGKPASVEEFVSRFSDLGESLRMRLSATADSTNRGDDKDGNTGGGNFLFADGSVRFLPWDMDSAIFLALNTIHGAEAIDADF